MIVFSGTLVLLPFRGPNHWYSNIPRSLLGWGLHVTILQTATCQTCDSERPRECGSRTAQKLSLVTVSKQKKSPIQGQLRGGGLFSWYDCYFLHLSKF